MVFAIACGGSRQGARESDASATLITNPSRRASPTIRNRITWGLFSTMLYQLCDAVGAFVYLRRSAASGRSLRGLGTAVFLPLSLALWTIGFWVESSAVFALFAVLLGGFLAMGVVRAAAMLSREARGPVERRRSAGEAGTLDQIEPQKLRASVGPAMSRGICGEVSYRRRISVQLCAEGLAGRLSKSGGSRNAGTE